MERSRGGSSESTISDLPEEVLIDILSRLSIKSIVSCRCVSKTWHNLLSSSNSQFTKLHFTRSPIQTILQTGFSPNVYFHIVELQDDTDVDDDDSIEPIPSKFRLSMCDLVAVNSCNGFLCLASFRYPLNPVILCNPITGEYLNLPNHKIKDHVPINVVYGFGCSAKTNQYKVVRLVHGGDRIKDWMVEVYTIGTNSWRTIGTAPKCSYRLGSTTFFNGAIHWFCYGYDELSSDDIISFDLESEKFGVVPPPPHFSPETIMERHDIQIGVLGEFLYLIYNMELWVMKEYGVQQSWTKMYVFDRRPFYTHEAIKYLSGGKILMNYDSDRLFSYDPVGKISKEFKVPWICRYFETFAHVPSFMSFNDAMMGDKGAKLPTMMCQVRVEGRD